MMSGLAVLAAVALSSGMLTSPPAYADNPAEQPRPGASSAGDRLFPSLGNGGYDVGSYEVSFDYRPDSTVMDSSVRITATAQHALSSFSLDAAGQDIQSVSVQNKPARFAMSGEKLRITPKQAVRKGQPFRVDITYRADRAANPPSPASPNLPRNLGAWENGDDGFSLLGQPDRAHLFFPMNDYPSDKARVTFRITTPKDLQAVASGTLQSRSTQGGRTTSTYTTRDPIPTQAVQAAVGRFKEDRRSGPRGLQLRSYVTADLFDKVKPEIDSIPSEVSWLEKRIGSTYPFEAYGLLGVDEFPAAFEGATLSTFSGDALARGGSPKVHELAHQYFGNAVSVKSWDDMWISEGHASFYSFLAMEEKQGVSFKDNVRRAYNFDLENRAEFGPPARLKSSQDVLGGTNAGGVVMLEGLRNMVGDSTFRNIERTFFDKYRHTSASTQDYINVANQVSGRDVGAFIKSWLYDATTPPLPAHLSPKPATPQAGQQ